MENKNYYLIIFAESNSPEVFTYCNRSRFTKEEIDIHKKRWEEKHNYFNKSIIVSEK